MKTPSCRLCAGGAEVVVRYTTRGGIPAGPFPKVDAQGRQYDEVLREDVLQPFLVRWRGKRKDERALLAASADAALDACVKAFARVANSDGKESGAILTALTLTANLQRTIVALAEALAQPAPPKRPKRRPKPVHLSHRWCGFALAPIKRGAGPLAQLSAVGRALACSPAEIEARSKETLAELRRELKTGKWLTMDDLV